MKKMFLFLLTCVNLQVFAQHEYPNSVVVDSTSHGIRKVTFGAVGGIFGAHFLDVGEHQEKHPFAPDVLIAYNLSVYAKKTFHELFYNLGENSLGLVNGLYWDEHHKWGTYVVLGKELSSTHLHTALGAERNFYIKTEADPWFYVKVVPFGEVGFSSENIFTFSVGISLSTQFILHEE